MIFATIFAEHSADKDFDTTQDQLEYILKKGLIKKAILQTEDLEGEDNEGRKLFFDAGLLEVDGVIIDNDNYKISWEINEIVESHENGLLIEVVIDITAAF